MADGSYKLIKENSGGTHDEKVVLAENGKVLGFDSELNPVMVINFETIGVACSNVTTALTIGQKAAFDMPFAFVVTRVFATVTTAPTDSALEIDVEDEGTTILDAVVSIASAGYNAETSTFTGSASSYALSKGDLLSIDIDQIGSTIAGAGLIVFLEGYRT